MTQSTYKLNVTFIRDIADDLDVIGKDLNETSDADLLQQFRKELQQAYDDGFIAGSFQIEAINTEGLRE